MQAAATWRAIAQAAATWRNIARPRGATPRPRSGAEARRTHARRAAAKRSYPASKVRGGGREEQHHAPKPEARGGSQKEQPTPEARGGGREEQPHIQGAVAVRVQEGLEELFHVQGQEGRR